MLRPVLLGLTILFINLCCSSELKTLNPNHAAISVNKYRSDTITAFSNRNNSNFPKIRTNETSQKNLDWLSIRQDSIASLFGGIAFALFLFIFKEYVFKNKNITGEWSVTNKINQTSYNPYQNLGIEYKIHLLQLGNQISGRGEKIKDLKPDGTIYHEYPNSKRINHKIIGYYEKNYLKSDKLYLLIEENGSIRATSSSYNLILPYFKKNLITGTFSSTAANSRGKTIWKKVN